MAITPHVRPRSLRRAAIVLALASLVLAGATTAQAQADDRTFADSGFTIADDAIWTFFNQYGGPATFGEPITREFTLYGAPTELFQNLALQVQPDGTVHAMQLTTQDVHLDGLTLPAADGVTAFVTPTPGQPNYSARLQVFLQSVIPDSIYETYTATGGTSVWGLPTSAARPDPNNPNFLYQRFQNGVLFYNASSGTTQPLPMGEYVKNVLSAQNPSPDVAQAFVPDAS